MIFYFFYDRILIILSIFSYIDFSKVVPTKASVAKIRRFQVYSTEDPSFFVRKSYDEEDQDLDFTLVEERRG